MHLTRPKLLQVASIDLKFSPTYFITLNNLFFLFLTLTLRNSAQLALSFQAIYIFISYVIHNYYLVCPLSRTTSCYWRVHYEQESIPVGCVPSAAVAIGGGVFAQAGVSQHALGRHPLPVNRITDRQV